MSRIYTICSLLFLLSLSSGAHAALVQHPFTGSVTFVDSGFTGGISLASAVTGSVTYDTALVSPSGLDEIPLGLNDPESNPAFSLVFNIGPYSFNQTDDTGYTLGYPYALFDNGQITGLDFIVETSDWTFDTLASDQFEIYSLDGNTTYVQGAIFFGEPLAVPLPAAAWLFASGLLGLIGIARRKAGRRAP